MTLDPDFIAIRSGDTTVPLSRLEYIVTRRVLRGGGAVVSWDDILMSAYDANEPEDGQKSLVVTIHNFRSKMQRYDLACPVEVVRGRGLRIAGDLT